MPLCVQRLLLFRWSSFVPWSCLQGQEMALVTLEEFFVVVLYTVLKMVFTVFLKAPEIKANITLLKIFRKYLLWREAVTWLRIGQGGKPDLSQKPVNFTIPVGHWLEMSAKFQFLFKIILVFQVCWPCIISLILHVWYFFSLFFLLIFSS